MKEFNLLIGKHLGNSSWMTVDQNKIDLFAKATDDFQWIHTDEKKTKTESPFKKTIAHGYYTLSLLPKFFNEVWECKNIGLVITMVLIKLGSFLQYYVIIKYGLIFHYWMHMIIKVVLC